MSTKDEPKLFYETKDYRDGFFPIGAFHRLCAGVLSSAMQREGVDVSMDQKNVYLEMFDEVFVHLAYAPSESSMLIRLYSNGDKSAAAKVLDRIRLLLLTDLTMFSNLRAKTLVPMSEHESVLVDIDKVMKTLGSEVRRVGETDYKIAEVKECMIKWVLTECEFNWIDAEKLRKSRHEEFPYFMKLQDLRASRPDWVI